MWIEIESGFNGPYEADRQEIYRRESPAQAAGDEGGQEVCSGHRRCEEAAPFQARDGGAAGDQEVSEEHGAADKEAAVPEAGEGDCSGLQDRFEVPEHGRGGPAGGGGGVSGGTVRGHQPLCYPREEGDHHAQGHPARSQDPWREGLDLPSLLCFYVLAIFVDPIIIIVFRLLGLIVRLGLLVGY
ncbi:hypothetical protein ACLOJK_020330 [Asimina triloba]